MPSTGSTHAGGRERCRAVHAIRAPWGDGAPAHDPVGIIGVGEDVVRLLYSGGVSVGFRPTEEDLRIIEANRRQDEKTSDVIRRALRLLDREAWEVRAREDMHRLRNEDLSAEPDAWEYDTDGNIMITGTNLAVPARSQDHP